MGISYQKGWVRPRGKKWHGCFRRTELDPETNTPKLVTHSFVLGFRSELSKSQAREKLEDEIAKLGGRSTGTPSVVNGAVTFEWFVKNRYLPLKEGDWREETAKIKKYLIQADLVDVFGDYRLENFDKVILQTHLNRLAKIHSRDRVLQIRSYMRAIFAEAVDQDFIPKDPARKVRPPANLREVDKTTLSWDQLRAALEKLGDISLRDWILMKLDMSNALRPSELFPLRWRCFLEDNRVLDIQETVYKGKLRPFGKTKSSLTKVPIADVLANEIAEYREECRKQGKDTSPDGFMFPGRFGGPMDSSNFRHRVLHKLARELELPKLTFQVIRRTIATLGKTKGHPKDIQGLMRHSRLATTMEVYMQSLQREVRTAINSIHDELVATGTEGPDPRTPEARAPGGQNRVTDERASGQKRSVVAEKKQHTTEGGEKKTVVPSRGKILPFAGKMRANGLGGVPLSS
ncbi:MAG TPA: tyrosine-type recombinase/integrase [Terracidiphilus sp.]|nr:tyrosine-type recombinase/integrase [Terracidiphilus sp.]